MVSVDGRVVITKHIEWVPKYVRNRQTRGPEASFSIEVDKKEASHDAEKWGQALKLAEQMLKEADAELYNPTK
jgi:hypothetical protein